MKRKPPNTTAKTVSQAASQEAARLEALFASIGEGVVATDENGTITRVNQVALDLLGMSRRQVMHRHLPSTIVAVHENGKTINTLERPIAKAFQLGETVTARTLYKRGDGSLLPVYVTVSPILLHKRPIGAIEVFRDLTAEIENDKLKSDFISIASHQLRTPLSAINMYTRMLHDGFVGELTQDQIAFTETVLASVERMNTLIDTLLNITRIEAGSIKIKLQPVRLDQLSHEITTECMLAARAKHITLDTDIAHYPTPIKTDNLLVKEICANLLSNAIKYTPDGGTVTFTMHVSDKTVDWVVSDTGYGIPTADQKNIFLKFFRAENIASKDVSGTGLGLYLVKNIAESLGGDLWFESHENVGTHFYFSLPIT